MLFKFLIPSVINLQEIRNEAEVEEDVDNIGFGHSQQRQMKAKRKKTGPKAKYPRKYLQLFLSRFSIFCS